MEALAMRRLGVALAMVVLVVATRVRGRRYVVGDEVGWTTGVNYSLWSATKSFFVGDSLYFDYFEDDHDVLQVGYQDYEKCTISSTLANYTEGESVVELTSAGLFYFVCGLGDHCLEGQKLQVSVYLQSASVVPSSFNLDLEHPPASDDKSSSPPQVATFNFLVMAVGMLLSSTLESGWIKWNAF